MRPIALGIAVLLVTSANGGIQHTLLHGVSVAHVRAAVGPGALPGVTREALVALGEARLKEAGVRRSPTSDADLSISVVVTTGESGSCYVSVDGRLVEEARLERNGLRVKAESWSGGGRVVVGALPTGPTGPADVCGKLTMDAVERVVKEFVDMYRATNPDATAGGK